MVVFQYFLDADALPPLAGMISTARSHQAAIFAPSTSFKWQNSRFRDNRAEADKLLRWKPAQNLPQLLIVNEQSSNNPTDQCQIHWQPAGF